MSYLVIRSPKGGKELSDIGLSWHTVCGQLVRGAVNLIIQPRFKPEISDDYIAWRVGYAETDIKRGDPLYIKRSDAKKLAKLLNYRIA